MFIKSKLHHVQHRPRVFSRLSSFRAMILNLSSVVRRETFEPPDPRWWLVFGKVAWRKQVTGGGSSGLQPSPTSCSGSACSLSVNVMQPVSLLLLPSCLHLLLPCLPTLTGSITLELRGTKTKFPIRLLSSQQEEGKRHLVTTDVYLFWSAVRLGYHVITTTGLM